MATTATTPDDVHLRPAELLRNLLRYDTTNPPGNEGPCVAYLAGLLEGHGVATTLLEKAPGRPNLVARLAGRGLAPPLLLYGHVDVVTTQGQAWTHPPFAGVEPDGYLWGRGAIDMKGGVAMLVAAFLRAKTQGLAPPGDVILCVLSDEEAEGRFGAGFLVDEHPGLFAGVRHALGEFGGFRLEVGGTRYYPVMVAEKQVCGVKATARGPAGHGSMPVRGGAVGKAVAMLTALDSHRLPVRITPAVRAMFEGMAAAASGPTARAFHGLLNPATTDAVLDQLGDGFRLFDALLHNTVSPTVLRGSPKANVIPAEVVVELDGRILPGGTPDDLIAELRALVGDEIGLEVTHHDPYPAEPDLSLFPTLAAILREADPGGVAVPFVLPAVTDGRHFARLGVQTYGFLPMDLPPDFDFIRTVHAADERIPVGAVEFGTRAVLEALRRFGEATP